MSKILITGAAGYLGRVLSPMLQEKHDVIGMDNFLYGQGNVGALHGDITSLKAMYNFTKGIDVVVALAGIVGDPACGLDEVTTRIVNLESTKLLIEACEVNKVKNLIFASSCSVYGASDKIITEKSRTKPLSLYAETKLASEKILLRRRRFTRPTILRFGTLFGYSPRMRFDLVVNIMTAMAVKEGKIIVNGGDQWRPMVHVKDVAKTIELMINDQPTYSYSKDRIWNVVGESYRIKDIADIVAKITGAEIVEKNELVDKRNYRVNSTMPANFFGIDYGVKEIIEHFKAGEFDDFKNNKYYNVKILQNLSA